MDGQISEADWDAAMEDYRDKKEKKADATDTPSW